MADPEGTDTALAVGVQDAVEVVGAPGADAAAAIDVRLGPVFDAVDARGDHADTCRARRALAVGPRAAPLPVGAGGADSAAAVDAGLVAILHAVEALGGRARSSLADVARAVIWDKAVLVVRAPGADRSASVDVRLVAIFGRVGARRIAIARHIDDSRSDRSVPRRALAARVRGDNEIPEDPPDERIL